jgi:hypothetical protein
MDTVIYYTYMHGTIEKAEIRLARANLKERAVTFVV